MAMLKIDNALLQELGLDALPDAEKNSLLKHIYETLEMRVGMRLADQMSNEQLDEFEQYFEAKDDAGAFKWLESNFPNYKDIVQQEFDKLKLEVGQAAPQIIGASQAALHENPGAFAPQPPQMEAQMQQPPYPPQPHQPVQAPQYQQQQPPTLQQSAPYPQQSQQPQYGQAPSVAPAPWQPNSNAPQQPPYPPQQPPAGPGNPYQQPQQ